MINMKRLCVATTFAVVAASGLAFAQAQGFKRTEVQRGDLSTGTVLTPTGSRVDFSIVENDDSLLERTYDGVHLFGTARIRSFDVLASYTLSKLEGNVNGETIANGPIRSDLRQYPEYRAILLSQRLKFTGHFLETTHKLAAMGLFTPTPAQQDTMKRATADVVATALILEKVGMWEQLGGLKGGEQHQMFLDFVGDSCHAVRGLDLATGRGTVLY